MPVPAMLEHGGTDLGPDVRWDFSTNANALGPLPGVLQALQHVGRRAYPEPSYAALREALGVHLGVSPARICPTAGNAEGIRRLSLAASLSGVDEVWLPSPGYGEYEAAAQALGLRTRAYADLADLAHLAHLRAALPMLDASERAMNTPATSCVLIWLCEPCNPTGQEVDSGVWQALQQTLLPRLMAMQALGAGPGAGPRLHLAIDRAYEPLRLRGPDPVPPALARAAWQLWSPNKAMALTGVRAGVMVAPAVPDGGAARPAGQPHGRDDGPPPGMSVLQARVGQLAPSWVLSAEGEALLLAWAQPLTQAALRTQRQTLSTWLDDQTTMLHSLGWTVRPSCVPFHLACPPVADLPAALASLRKHGIKLRDATSLGLPGWVRLRAMPPQAQTDLAQAWRRHIALQQDAA
jgi:histidinol-phosphate aminotransferase